MKFITVSVITALTSLASVAAFATPVGTYQCGAKKISVTQADDTYVVQIAYVATDITTHKSHTVHITSEPVTLKSAADIFAAQESMAGKALKALTALPDASAAFSGFHYPNGQMYVTSEGDTNEEGYFFAASPSLLQGEANAEASEIFWSYFENPKVAGGVCTRLN